MQIIPAIDLREGVCARVWGAEEVETDIFASDPIEQMQKFSEVGVSAVHITDLDGAFSGHLCDQELLRRLAEFSDIDIELCGGIRSMNEIDTVLNWGIKRVILGTALLRSPQMVTEATAKYGKRVVAGLDVRDGMIALEGFETTLSKAAEGFLAAVRQMGIRRIVYTDIHRYGSLKGVDFQQIENLIACADMEVVVAGGLSKVEQLHKLEQMGVSGVIIGKAIYTGKIDLNAALQFEKNI